MNIKTKVPTIKKWCLTRQSLREDVEECGHERKNPFPSTDMMRLKYEFGRFDCYDDATRIP